MISFLTSVRRHSLFGKPCLRSLQQPTAFLFLRYTPPSVPEVMGNRKISNDLKEGALNLWNWGWDLEDITDALLVSQRICRYNSHCRQPWVVGWKYRQRNHSYAHPATLTLPRNLLWSLVASWDRFRASHNATASGQLGETSACKE